MFGIAVATAIFPALAKVANDSGAFANILRRGLRLVVYFGLPASVGLMLVRVPLTAAILQGKNFTAADTQRVALVLLGYAPAIWAYSMTHTLTRAFYARGDSFTPVRVAMGIVALNLVLNVTLIWTPLKESGLAWSTATCAIVQVVILLRLIRRHAPHALDQSVVSSWMKTAFISAIMAATVYFIGTRLAPSPALAGTWGWSVIELGILVGAGAIVVGALSIALRMPEFKWALGKSGGLNARLRFPVTFPRVFILSPAHCGGERAQLLMRPKANFPLARQLRSKNGCTIAATFSFLSGLYFRGKVTYATAFKSPPKRAGGRGSALVKFCTNLDASGALVITTNRGLVDPNCRITIDDLRAMGAGDIDPADPCYRQPLERDAKTLSSVLGPTGRAILLGSIASGKYCDILLKFLGSRVLFPQEFIAGAT